MKTVEEEEEKKRKHKVCSGQWGDSGGGRQQWQLVGLYAYVERMAATAHRASCACRRERRL